MSVKYQNSKEIFKWETIDLVWVDQASSETPWVTEIVGRILVYTQFSRSMIKYS